MHVADIHVVEQVAEVGLVDAELALDSLRGRTDLASHDLGAGGDTLADEPLLDRVRRIEFFGADQVAHRGAGDAGRVGHLDSRSTAAVTACWSSHAAI